MAICDMGWTRQLSPLIGALADGSRELILSDNNAVGLVIFGFDTAQRDHEKWKEPHFDNLKKAIAEIRAAGAPKHIRLASK